MAPHKLLMLAMGLLLMASLVALAWLIQPHPSTRAPARDSSIAVLAFDKLNTGSEQSAIGAELAQQLVRRLTMRKQLRVAEHRGRYSSRGLPTDIQAVARQLEVSHVLTGKVHDDGEQIRVTVNLFNAAGFHLWSRQFAGSLEQPVLLQDQISNAVAAEILKQ